LGIIKKVGYMVLLALAFFVDYIISYLVSKAGIQSPVNGLFGVATTCWLIGTEGLSILENLNIIGVPFPPFLKSAFKKLKDESEQNITKSYGGDVK
jgi:phage-related holin